jgi:hypothetical protein
MDGFQKHIDGDPIGISLGRTLVGVLLEDDSRARSIASAYIGLPFLRFLSSAEIVLHVFELDCSSLSCFLA